MSAPIILLADDDDAIRMVLNQVLTRAGYEVRPTGNLSTMWNWVSRGEGDLLISDVMMPDGNAFDLMPKIKSARPNLPVIIMSAQNTFMTAIRASKEGAYEYLPKPFDIDEVLSIVSRALSEVEKPKKDELVTENKDNMPLVGRSPAMQEIYRSLARLMQTDLSVMISGESGTGKELVAKALHDYGKRKNRPFIAINMAAIPKDLIEAELFGHEKGAFTGATSRSMGRFEQADGGTLFLDEIGDMPMEAQTRLLRVLQDGEFTMVGGRNLIKSDVRIVAATHQDLQQMIIQGQFREDLYYRLNVVPISLPPLRDRKEDVADLVSHFMREMRQEGELVKSISQKAIELLQLHSWPGNVRELENMVMRLNALYADETISAEIISLELNRNENHSENSLSDKLDLGSAVEKYIAGLLNEYDDDTVEASIYQTVLDKFEAPLIAMTLNACKGNQIKASKILGLNRNTLRKKIRAHDIEITKYSRRK
ncbi:MAG: nitrogen regulation protein NR(I) [Devosiaceae bacterium]|nr:nitrogen regulation protein NR(I) [Devosiaceae bacterium]